MPSYLLGGTSRGCRQRRSRREAITCRGNRAITSINELYSGPGACQASPGPRGEAQCIAQEGIRQAMVDLDAPPKDLHVQEAVRQLLREDTRYSDDAVGGAGTLATYGMGEVSLPSDVANCPEVVQVLPQGKADVFRGFREQMLRSPEDFEEHQALVGEAGLYMDPVLAKNRRKYIQFVKQLRGKGIVCFSLHADEHCGIFFVTKKSGALRFICDARRTNARFKPPPCVKLPTGEAFSRIN